MTRDPRGNGPAGDVTVVISAAGRGSRLGHDMPKCLVEVAGRRVIDHQFDVLGDLDVVVVVGFRADDVIDHVRRVRPQTRFAENPDYLTTGTAASLVIGARGAASTVISLDGDLLVGRTDLERLLRCERPTIGLTPTASVTAVGADVDEGVVRGLGFEIESPWEWSGLLRMSRDDVLGFGTEHVFHGLIPHLPVDWIDVDCVEIDEPVDLERAERWIADQAAAEQLDRDVITEFWNTRAASGRTRWTDDGFLAYERAWLPGHVPGGASILDLGSGYGELSRSICPPEGRLLAVDQVDAYAAGFADDPRFRFVRSDITAFRSDERFDLCLLFGVVTHLDVDDETALYRRIAAMLTDDGTFVVKNQCSDGEEFSVDTYSEDLGSRYVGRYPSVDGQRRRLAEVFADVEVRPYPEEMRMHPDSSHVAFVCRGVL